MNRFGATRICGRNDGTPFLNATRPSLNNTCPKGFAACSPNTDAEHTICYNKTQDRERVCPINDIKFVATASVTNYTAAGYTARTFNSSASLVFTKNSDKLPITETRVEN